MSRNSKRTANKKRNKTPKEKKVVEIAVAKLLDGGGSAIDALLVRYTLTRHNAERNRLLPKLQELNAPPLYVERETRRRARA